VPFSSVVVTKGRAHRVRRVAAAKPDLPAIFPERAVDGVGIHAAFRSERLAVAAQGTEQRCIGLITVAGAVQIGADALRRSGIDGERLAPPLRVTRSVSKPRFWCRSPTLRAAISARRKPTCRPTENPCVMPQICGCLGVMIR